MNRLAALVLLPLFAQATVAVAEPTSVRPADDQALIRTGIELRQAQQDEEALRLFRRAWEVSKSGRALAQMALAEQALGRWLDAETHLAAALERHGDEWIERNRTLLEQSLGDIAGHLGWLELTGEIPTGWVAVNGQRASGLPPGQVLRVPAGSVAIEAHADGYLPIVRMVVVPARGLAREPLAFVPIAAPPVPAAPPVVTTIRPPTSPLAARWTTRDTAGVLVGGAAIAALATGIAFHVVREQRAGAYNDLGCGAPTSATDLRACQSRYDGVQTATYLSIAGYTGAAAASALAAYLLFGGRPTTPTATVSASPSCGLAPGPGIVCGGRF